MLILTIPLVWTNSHAIKSFSYFSVCIHVVPNPIRSRERIWQLKTGHWYPNLFAPSECKFNADSESCLGVIISYRCQELWILLSVQRRKKNRTKITNLQYSQFDFSSLDSENFFYRAYVKSYTIDRRSKKVSHFALYLQISSNVPVAKAKTPQLHAFFSPLMAKPKGKSREMKIFSVIWYLD